MIQSFLAVFIGGGIGSLLRYGISLALPSNGFPWATFVANVVSCLLLGILIGWLDAVEWTNDRVRLFLVTGLCGGFSTFSTFSYETFKLWSRGEHFAVLANIGGSVAVCLVCILLGIKIVSTFI